MEYFNSLYSHSRCFNRGYNTYTLKEREDGNQWGGIYFVYSWNDDYMRYTDNMNYKGEMTITKLDVQKQIISGTF